jgi:hypothetical protein
LTSSSEIHVASSSSISPGSLDTPPKTSNWACYQLDSIISSCNSQISAFETLGIKQQASCFCYTSSSSWAPNGFDNAASSCIQYARTAQPLAYKNISTFQGLCARLGSTSITRSRALNVTLNVLDTSREVLGTTSSVLFSSSMVSKSASGALIIQSPSSTATRTSVAIQTTLINVSSCCRDKRNH